MHRAAGTCTTGDALLSFRTGAFVAGKPVLPVLLRYACPVNCGFVVRPPLRSRLWGWLPGELVHCLRIAAPGPKEIVVRVR